MRDYESSKFAYVLRYQEPDWHRGIEGRACLEPLTKKERIHNLEQRVEKLSEYIDTLAGRIRELERLAK